jgi:ubiquitin-like domain-containing CTD phosphatase 1
VLDIDYTLFDLNSSAERPDELARPFLHEFLSACYEFYDIIIWSATNMKWVEVRRQLRYKFLHKRQNYDERAG